MRFLQRCRSTGQRETDAVLTGINESLDAFRFPPDVDVGHAVVVDEAVPSDHAMMVLGHRKAFELGWLCVRNECEAASPPVFHDVLLLFETRSVKRQRRLMLHVRARVGVGVHPHCMRDWIRKCD